MTLTIRDTVNSDFMAIMGCAPPDAPYFYKTVCDDNAPISIAGIVSIGDGLWEFTHNHITLNYSAFKIFTLSCVIVQWVADMKLDVLTRTNNLHKKYVEKLGFYFVCEDDGDLIYRLVN